MASSGSPVARGKIPTPLQIQSDLDIRIVVQEVNFMLLSRICLLQGEPLAGH